MDSPSHDARVSHDHRSSYSAKTDAASPDRTRVSVPQHLAQRSRQPPVRLTAADIHYLQRTAGNRAVSLLLGRENVGAQAQPAGETTPTEHNRNDHPSFETRHQGNVQRKRTLPVRKAHPNKAYVGIPAIQRTSHNGNHGSATLIQRTDLGEFVKKQEKLQTKAKQNPDRYQGKYTTVGFEHEFAQMTDGRLQGASHVEVAKSKTKMPYTGLPFVLETDADNALELVSPPFLLKTVEGRPLPLPEEVEETDTIFRDRLSELTEGNPTIGELITDMRADGIDFTLKNITVKAENMTQNTQDTVFKKIFKNRSKLTANELRAIPLMPSKKGGGISTHVNFATDLETYHLMQQVSDEPSGPVQKAYDKIETELLKKMKELCLRGDRRAGKQGVDQKTRKALAAAKKKVDRFIKALQKYIERIQSAFDECSSGWHMSFLQYAGYDKGPDPFKQLNALMTELEKGDLASEQLQLLSLNYPTSGGALERVRALLTDYVTRFYKPKEEPKEQPTVKIDESTEELAPQQTEMVEPKKAPIEMLLEAIDVGAEKLASQQMEMAEALHSLPFRRASEHGLSMFLSALARTLSGQLAVPALGDLRNAQKQRYKNPESKLLEDMTYQRVVTSRVKDVHDVWIKDTIFNLGLGVLTPQEWQKVRDITTNSDFRSYIKNSLPEVRVGKETISRDTYGPMILKALDQLKTQIEKHKLNKTDSRNRPKINFAKTFINPKSQPKLFSHDSKWIGVRQDTYIPAKNVQMPLWTGKRLHVVESRSHSVEMLGKVKNYYEGMPSEEL